MPATVDKSISVIDDDEAIGSSIVSLLRSMGYKGTSYLSAEAFLASAAIGDLDCIISDIYMPGQSGLELMRILRNQGYKTPFILISAKADEHLTEKAVEIGAVCLLRKPFDAQQLIDCIERALSSTDRSLT